MHESDIAADFLRRHPPFDRLDENALGGTAAALEAAYYREGQRVLDSSEDSGLAIIRKGAVRLLDEDRRFLDQRSEGECFGHAGWFRGVQKPYVAEAEEDCLVWHLPAERFEKLKAAHRDFADWFDQPLGERLRHASAPPPARCVGDLLRREPVSVPAEASIRDTAVLMSDERVSSVLVMDGERLAGILTDKDLRRRVTATGRDTATPVREVMTPDPSTLPGTASVNDALLTMMGHGYHHLPVVEDGRALGLVTAGDLLRAQSEHPLRLLQDIERQRDLDGLVKISARLPALFVRMVDLGRDVDQAGRMITQVTDAFTHRLVAQAEAELGPAPMPWAWMAFGSQGRQEQSARTDQDNGIVTAEPVSGEAAAWFEALAKRVCDGLDRLGYVYCPGEIMAINPRWRVDLKAWKRHFDQWVDEPDPKSVMHSSIFFDLRCIAGSDALVAELRHHAVTRARDNRIFRRFMAANALTHRPPIGFFRRFVQEDDGQSGEGIDLKKRGIVPIIDLARLRAFEGGVESVNTFDRLRDATATGTMNAGDAANLRDALTLITRLRLTHQAGQLARGETAGNLVPVESLSPLMRRNLKGAFLLVREAQQALAVRYQVH